MSHDGPFYIWYQRRFVTDSGGKTLDGETYDLVETLGSTQTGRASANDEDVNVAGERRDQSRFVKKHSSVPCGCRDGKVKHTYRPWWGD